MSKKTFVNILAAIIGLTLGAVVAAQGQSVRITQQPDSVYRLLGTYITAGGSVVSNRAILWAISGPCLATPVPGTSYGRHVYVRATAEGTCPIVARTTVSGRTYSATITVGAFEQTRFVVRTVTPVPPPPPPPPPAPPPPAPPPPAPVPLKAIIKEPVVCSGLSCVLDGSGSTGSIAKYEWYSVCALCGTATNFTGPIWNYTAPAATPRSRALRVTSTTGQVAEDTVTFTPSPPPALPDTAVVAALIMPRPREIEKGASVQFCLFIRFANGALAMRAKDAVGCSSYYAALIPRSPSSTQQTLVDSYCWIWKGRGGVIEPDACPGGGSPGGLQELVRRAVDQ
jgi:hypothetical protein